MLNLSDECAVSIKPSDARLPCLFSPHSSEGTINCESLSVNGILSCNAQTYKYFYSMPVQNLTSISNTIRLKIS